MPFEIIILSEDEYRKEYKTAFLPTNSPTKESLASEFDRLDKRLHTALARRWKTDPQGDAYHFEISDEWQGTFHHCGGIYSKHICCPEYVQTIVNAISVLPHADLWTYHTAVESMDGGIDSGGFFIRGGKMYAPDDGYKYTRYFASKSTKVTRRKTPLTIHRAADKGNLSAIRRLLDGDPDLVCALDDLKQTPLYRAVWKRQTKAVKLLLARGAEAANRESLGPLLHIASSGNGSAPIARILLGRGAAVDARDNQGQTPLHLAALCKQEEIARLLVAKGADVRARDKGGMTPLHWTTHNDQTATAALLLRKGAEVNAVDRVRRTSLFLAAEYGATRVAKLLLDRGADTDATDKDDRTPLYVACWNCRVELVRMLLARGLKPGLDDRAGWSVLNTASKVAPIVIVRALLTHGADVHARASDGATPSTKPPARIERMW